MRKILCGMLVLAFIFSSMVMQTLAYHSGDREILYYSFSYGDGEMGQSSSSSMKRLYDRQWVVSVTSRKNNKYDITYGMIDNNATEWYNAIVSNVAREAGTGNFGSTYFSSETVGWYLYLGALIDERDLDAGVKTSGQWSTDAAK